MNKSVSYYPNMSKTFNKTNNYPNMNKTFNKTNNNPNTNKIFKQNKYTSYQLWNTAVIYIMVIVLEITGKKFNNSYYFRIALSLISVKIRICSSECAVSGKTVIMSFNVSA